MLSLSIDLLSMGFFPSSSLPPFLPPPSALPMNIQQQKILLQTNQNQNQKYTKEKEKKIKKKTKNFC